MGNKEPHSYKENALKCLNNVFQIRNDTTSFAKVCGNDTTSITVNVSKVGIYFVSDYSVTAIGFKAEFVVNYPAAAGKGEWMA